MTLTFTRFLVHPPRRAMYICRACGAEIATPSSYTACPVCGIKWG